MQWYHNSRIRRWIDEGNGVQPLEEMMKNPPTPSPSMDFIVRIVNAIRADLVSGTYIPSTDISAAYFPPIYYVFLSEPDIRGWKGERLEHLQARVAEGVMKKISELDKRKTTQTVRIEVKPDGTLNPGQIRVQSLDSFVRSTGQYDVDQAGMTPRLEVKSGDERRTEKDTSRAQSQVYDLQIFLNGILDQELTVERAELIVGRGTKADIKLKDIDARIGREHCKLLFGDGAVFCVAMNDNPTIVNDNILNRDDKAQIFEGDTIRVYGYELKAKFR